MFFPAAKIVLQWFAMVCKTECILQQVLPVVDFAIGTQRVIPRDCLHFLRKYRHTQVRGHRNHPCCVFLELCVKKRDPVYASLLISLRWRIGDRIQHPFHLQFVPFRGGNLVKKWKSPGHHLHHNGPVRPSYPSPHQAISAPLRTMSDRVRRQRRSSAHAVSGRPRRDLRQPWHR